MNKNLGLLIIVLLSICIGYLIGSEKEVLLPYSDNTQSIKRLQRLIRYIKTDYVESIDTDSLVETVLEDLVERLDPHSVYISARERQTLSENMQGNFHGIGVGFFMNRDSVTITKVIEGGPSKEAGLMPGDRILMADNDTLFQKNYSTEKIIQTLRGKLGTPVDLTLYRKAEDRILKVKLNRGKVPLPSVEAYYLMDGMVGYMKINRFSQTTYQEFDNALRKLLSEGMEKLILDLRDNPGGYMLPAQQISNTFLKKDQTIVITQSNHREKERSYAEGNGIFQQGSLIVLVNEKSASASEIVAGAIQDNDRGWIVGKRTFGKGLVQQQMSLGGGDAVRLTTARYFTPTGRSIQKPYNKDRVAYYDELIDRYHNGEMGDREKIPITDSLAYKTPKGRTVYGGGGIIPDFFVPTNTSEEEAWIEYVLNSFMMSNFVFNELDKNWNQFLALKKEDVLSEMAEKIIPWHRLFMKYCDSIDVIVSPDEKQTLKAAKAFLGLQLFDENTFYQIKNQDDPYVATAIKKLQELKK
jgi:carboxyl-terminal processing protease